MLLMSETEIFSPKPANFFVTAKEKPGFNLRGMEDIAECEDTAAIIAANALRTYENIFVGGKTNIANGFIMNGVEVGDE